jgi:hypothetical protein
VAKFTMENFTAVIPIDATPPIRPPSSASTIYSNRNEISTAPREMPSARNVPTSLER